MRKGLGGRSPDPTPPTRRRGSGIYLTSEFLVVLSQHAYGNFLMQSDSHVTAVAPFEQRSLCIRLQRRSCFLFIARSRRSAWKDVYQQLTGRVVAGMATALPICCLCSAVLAVANRRRVIALSSEGTPTFASSSNPSFYQTTNSERLCITSVNRRAFLT